MEKIIIICFSIIIILIAFLSIFLHEVGHYYAMRKCDVSIKEISIGFGPKLFKTGIGQTRYAIRLGIILGGFVMPYYDIVKSEKHTLFQKLYVFSFGIIVNLIIAIASLGLYKFMILVGNFENIINQLTINIVNFVSDLNFDLAILNLIPFLGISDGSKILKVLVDKCLNCKLKKCVLILINIFGTVYFIKFFFT